MPDTKPLAEVGMPGFDMSSWHTIATRSGVPRDIVEKLAAAIREGMADPEVTQDAGPRWRDSGGVAGRG